MEDHEYDVNTPAYSDEEYQDRFTRHLNNLVTRSGEQDADSFYEYFGAYGNERKSDHPEVDAERAYYKTQAVRSTAAHMEAKSPTGSLLDHIAKAEGQSRRDVNKWARSALSKPGKGLWD